MTTATTQIAAVAPVRSEALLAFLEGFAAGFDKGQNAASAYEWGHGKSWAGADIRAAGEDAWQDAECNKANAGAVPRRNDVGTSPLLGGNGGQDGRM